MKNENKNQEERKEQITLKVDSQEARLIKIARQYSDVEITVRKRKDKIQALRVTQYIF